MVVTLVVGLWATMGWSTRSGSAWDGEVLRTGTAEITDCRRAVSTMFLSHICTAEITWQQEVGVLPSNVGAAREPYRVWSPEPVSGTVEIETHRDYPLTRRGTPQEVITTPEHPAGSGRGWLGAAYAALVVLPLALGLVTLRILIALGIAPRGTPTGKPDHR